METLKHEAAINPDYFYRMKNLVQVFNVTRKTIYTLIKIGVLPALERPYGDLNVVGYFGSKLITIIDDLKLKAEKRHEKSRPGPGRPRKNPETQK